MPEKPPPLRRGPTASAGSWVRTLHCKSAAADDVAARVAVAPKKLHPRLPRAGCGGSGDALPNRVASSKPSASRPKAKAKPGTRPSPEPAKKTKPAAAVPPSPPPGPLGPVPALTELPAGHSSRQVVEIIFLSSWSAVPQHPLSPGAPPTTAAAAISGSGGAFPGVVEMLFRVHNPARAVARFEDYRAAVRARAGGASRSAADGNEMMRFAPAPQYDDPCRSSSPAAATTAGGEEEAPRIRTFDGSGGAHASVRGPVTGRRAMFLCRVIAGRVAEAGTGGAATGKERFDSVRACKKSGELVVFDRRAVLPCFLIIYRL